MPVDLLPEDSDFLHHSIYEYFQWYHHVSSHSTDVSNILIALESTFPETSFADPTQRPLLVSELRTLKTREKALDKSPLSTVFCWNDYYESLKVMAEQESYPPDTYESRGALSWCVNQRWAYKKYSHSISDEKHDPESHLTAEKIELLQNLGFDFVGPEEQSRQARGFVHRYAQTASQTAQWKTLFEKYAPLLQTRAKKSENENKAVDVDELRRAEKWLAVQIDRYRDWDAGFVDFPSVQRSALQERGLLPQLELSKHRNLINTRRIDEVNPKGRDSNGGLDDMNKTDAKAFRKRKEVKRTVGGGNLSQKRLSFDKRYSQLVAFGEEHGHLNVTQTLNPSLATWVKKERIKLRRQKLDYPVDRKAMLDEINFCWEPKNVSVDEEDDHLLLKPRIKQEESVWWQRFAELKAYKAKFGNLRVPRGYKEGPMLSTWLRHQREKYRRYNRGQGSFFKHRREALKGLGFEEDLELLSKAADEKSKRSRERVGNGSADSTIRRPSRSKRPRQCKEKSSNYTDPDAHQAQGDSRTLGAGVDKEGSTNNQEEVE